MRSGAKVKQLWRYWFALKDWILSLDRATHKISNLECIFLFLRRFFGTRFCLIILLYRIMFEPNRIWLDFIHVRICFMQQLLNRLFVASKLLVLIQWTCFRVDRATSRLLLFTNIVYGLIFEWCDCYFLLLVLWHFVHRWLQWLWMIELVSAAVVVVLRRSDGEVALAELVLVVLRLGSKHKLVACLWSWRSLRPPKLTVSQFEWNVICLIRV